MIQAKLTPTQKKRKRLLGDVFLGLAERQLRLVAARLARPRLDQRDRRQHRPARLEVPDARARARRRLDDRQRARLRRRRRRRPARVRPEDGQGALEVPDRPPDRRRARRSTPSTARSTSRSRRRHADVVERRRPAGADGVRLGGDKTDSRRRRTCPRSAARPRPRRSPTWRSRPRASPTPASTAERHAAAQCDRLGADQDQPARSSSGRGTRTRRTGVTFGKVFLGKSPVAGARVRVDGYTLPSRPGRKAASPTPPTSPTPRRHEVRVVDLEPREGARAQAERAASRRAARRRGRVQRRLPDRRAAREGAVERHACSSPAG